MMSLMVAVNASYMSNELLLCEVSLHPVADAATANPPTNYGITTRVNRRFAAPDYRKMAEPLAHEIN
jgi:hypothetical protein